MPIHSYRNPVKAWRVGGQETSKERQDCHWARIVNTYLFLPNQNQLKPEGRRARRAEGAEGVERLSLDSHEILILSYHNPLNLH